MHARRGKLRSQRAPGRRRGVWGGHRMSSAASRGGPRGTAGGFPPRPPTGDARRVPGPRGVSERQRACRARETGTTSVRMRGWRPGYGGAQQSTWAKRARECCGVGARSAGTGACGDVYRQCASGDAGCARADQPSADACAGADVWQEGVRPEDSEALHDPGGLLRRGPLRPQLPEHPAGVLSRRGAARGSVEAALRHASGASRALAVSRAGGLARWRSRVARCLLPRRRVPHDFEVLASCARFQRLLTLSSCALRLPPRVPVALSGRQPHRRSPPDELLRLWNAPLSHGRTHHASTAQRVCGASSTGEGRLQMCILGGRRVMFSHGTRETGYWIVRHSVPGQTRTGS